MPYTIVSYKSHHTRTISPYYIPDHAAVLEVMYSTHSSLLLHYLYLPMLLYTWLFTNMHMVAAIVIYSVLHYAKARSSA